MAIEGFLSSGLNKPQDDSNLYAPTPVSYSVPQISSFDPSADPVYISYLRSLGLNESQQKGQIDRQRQYLNDSLAAQRPVMADQRAAAIAGIQNSAAARGVFNSTQRQDQEGKANTAYQRQVAGAERANAYQNANLSESYRNNLAQNSLARENQALASQQRQAGAALEGQIAQAQYQQQLQMIEGGKSALDSKYGKFQ